MELHHRSGLRSSRALSSKGSYFLWFTVLALISTSLAARITLNGNSDVEYGQGVYPVSACDQWVGIVLTPSEAWSDGYSRVGNIIFQGLDVTRCAKTSIQLHLQEEGTATPMSLFTNLLGGDIGTVVTLIIANGATQATADTSVTLLNPDGTNIGYGDESQRIEYNTTSGNFTVLFSKPIAKMTLVKSIMLESTSTS